MTGYLLFSWPGGRVNRGTLLEEELPAMPVECRVLILLCEGFQGDASLVKVSMVGAPQRSCLGLWTSRKTLC